jgi:hypothetical protein
MKNMKIMKALVFIFFRRDPLAQTFSFTENRVLSAVGIQFTQRDASIPVTVQIRGVTTGLPNDAEDLKTARH